MTDIVTGSYLETDKDGTLKQTDVVISDAGQAYVPQQATIHSGRVDAGGSVSITAAPTDTEVRDDIAKALLFAYWTDPTTDPAPFMYRAFAKADVWMKARTKTT